MSDLSTNLLASYHEQFTYYRHVAQAALDQLPDADLFLEDAAGSNSIAVIVKHLAGNIRSRWTDFLTTDGEKPWRNRDNEFVDDYPDRAALQADWDESWDLLVATLTELREDQLTAVVYIRTEPHTVTEAINRQLAHFAYHVGQIVLLGKLYRGTEWRSLTIPRGGLEAYNAKIRTSKPATPSPAPGSR